MSLNQLTNPAQANWPAIVNENFAAAGVELYAYNYQTTTGLTEGGYGGDYGTTAISPWTVTLTASDTNYIVAHLTTGVVSVSIATTNWDDLSTYGRVRRCVTDGSGVTSRIDWRFLEGGIFRTGSAGSVSYSPADNSDWSSSADPGDISDALDQLAERVTGLEAGGAGDEHYEVDGTPASDDTWGGRGITGVNAGATIAQWEAVYLASDGEWALADANGTGTYPCRGLAAAAGSDGSPMTVVTEGVIRNDAWAWGTLGAPIYLSATPGGLTQTAPSSSGDKVQQVGFAITADVMYLCIGAATYIEVA